MATTATALSPPTDIPHSAYPAETTRRIWKSTTPSVFHGGLVLIKWWLLAIPLYLVVSLLEGGDGVGLVTLLALFGAVGLLFNGRYPRDVFELVMGFNRWTFRAVAYAALMTDEYPPFRLAP